MSVRLSSNWILV